MTLNFQNWGFSVFLQFVAGGVDFKSGLRKKSIELNQDNLRIGTAKAVARLMSFAQITCIICPMLCCSNETDNEED